MKTAQKVLAFCLAAVLLSVSAVTAFAETPTYGDRMEKAIVYIKDHFKADFEDEADPATALHADLWSLLCVISAGKSADPEYSFMIPTVSASALDTESAAIDYAKTILSVSALGQDPKNFEGRNLAEELADRQQPDGSFTPNGGATANELPFIITALELSGVDYEHEKAVDALTSLQKSDGGYTYLNSLTEGNVDTTGMVLMGLGMTPYGLSKASGAVNYLEGTLKEGYFVGKGAYDTANSCSQAMGILGLAAVNEDLLSDRWAGVADALCALQTDAGGFVYMAGLDTPDYYSTYQSILALAALQAAEAARPESSSQPSSSAPPTTDGTPSLSSGSAATTSATAADGGPNTGDRGVSPVFIILLAVGVAAVAVCIIVPKVKKGGNKPQDSMPQNPPDDKDDNQ